MKAPQSRLQKYWVFTSKAEINSFGSALYNVLPQLNELKI
jgi:hypothetical protein